MQKKKKRKKFESHETGPDPSLNAQVGVHTVPSISAILSVQDCGMGYGMVLFDYLRESRTFFFQLLPSLCGYMIYV